MEAGELILSTDCLLLFVFLGPLHHHVLGWSLSRAQHAFDDASVLALHLDAAQGFNALLFVKDLSHRRPGHSRGLGDFGISRDIYFDVVNLVLEFRHNFIQHRFQATTRPARRCRVHHQNDTVRLVVQFSESKLALVFGDVDIEGIFILGHDRFRVSLRGLRLLRLFG